MSRTSSVARAARHFILGGRRPFGGRGLVGGMKAAAVAACLLVFLACGDSPAAPGSPDVVGDAGCMHASSERQGGEAEGSRLQAQGSPCDRSTTAGMADGG